MKNRYIPFGYQVIGGEPVFLETEKTVVENIFSGYLSGMSFGDIAQELSSGTVPYSKDRDNVWDKNMVKRILENQKYLGGLYPKLVDKKIFDEVKQLRESKRSKTVNYPKRNYKTEYICGICNRQMEQIKTNIFKCNNENCVEFKKSKNLKDLPVVDIDIEINEKCKNLNATLLLEKQKETPDIEKIIELEIQLTGLEITLSFFNQEVQKNTDKYKKIIFYENNIKQIQ